MIVQLTEGINSCGRLWDQGDDCGLWEVHHLPVEIVFVILSGTSALQSRIVCDLDRLFIVSAVAASVGWLVIYSRFCILV